MGTYLDFVLGIYSGLWKAEEEVSFSLCWGNPLKSTGLCVKRVASIDSQSESRTLDMTRKAALYYAVQPLQSNPARLRGETIPLEDCTELELNVLSQNSDLEDTS